MSTPEKDEPVVQPPQQSGGPGMRMGSFGMPTEKPKDFGAAARKLVRRLRVERGLIAFAIVMTILSVYERALPGSWPARSQVRAFTARHRFDDLEGSRVVASWLIGSWPAVRDSSCFGRGPATSITPADVEANSTGCPG